MGDNREMSLTMYTTTWCPDCRRAKRFLQEHQVEFREIDVETDPGLAALITEKNGGKRKVPTFDHDGHWFHCSPYNPAILKRELDLS